MRNLADRTVHPDWRKQDEETWVNPTLGAKIALAKQKKWRVLQAGGILYPENRSFHCRVRWMTQRKAEELANQTLSSP